MDLFDRKHFDMSRQEEHCEYIWIALTVVGDP